MGQNSYQIFDKANSFYETKLYDSSKTLYLELYHNGMISKELFLNLGNSYFKLDSLPAAILFYEKGLKIAPGNKDLTHNLQFCNTLLKDKNSIKKSILINELILSFLGKSPNYWAYSSIILMLITCLLFIFYRITFESFWKKIYFYSSILTLLLLIATIGLSAVSKSKVSESKYGIIFSPTTKVMVEPSLSSSTTYQLHEGSKAKITGENKDWYEISFNDRKGWVQKIFLKKI
jgi:tetratricopeptide (TPR) repeat protein